MSTWLFDLGNTRLKYAQQRADGSVGGMRAIPHDDEAWLARLPAGRQACVASVAGDGRGEALLAALRARFGCVQLAATLPRLGRLRIAYREPRHLGVDRFLAMLAAVEDAGAGATLVVGLGTALTVDLVDADGLHRGGRIAPSPALMRQALHARAPVLAAEGGSYAEFADDTIHALASGCEGAALALVARSLHAAGELLGASPRLWLHGGGAAALRARLPVHDWVPDAVLRGLSAWQRHAVA